MLNRPVRFPPCPRLGGPSQLRRSETTSLLPRDPMALAFMRQVCGSGGSPQERGCVLSDPWGNERRDFHAYIGSRFDRLIGRCREKTPVAARPPACGHLRPVRVLHPLFLLFLLSG